jgi:hypothetical protein
MDKQRQPMTIQNIWRLVLAILACVAIVQELRKPKDERTWHGKVIDFVPYDFRVPTWERVKDTYWNPEGPIITGKVFGVGWAPNFGGFTKLFGK